jgi:hypothetical protein
MVYAALRGKLFMEMQNSSGGCQDCTSLFDTAACGGHGTTANLSSPADSWPSSQNDKK